MEQPYSSGELSPVQSRRSPAVSSPNMGMFLRQSQEFSLHAPC